jgi:hypothetical protein
MVKVKEIAGGMTSVAPSIGGNVGSGAVVSGGGNIYTDAPLDINFNRSPELYQLFYSKLSFTLGDSKELMWCKETKNSVIMYGSIEPLCMHGSDKVPEDANQPPEVIEYQKKYRQYINRDTDDTEWRGELLKPPVKPW